MGLISTSATFGRKLWWQFLSFRQQVLDLWSDIARNDEEKTGDRLRATELLGESQGDFSERTENKNLNVHAQLDRLEVLTNE